METMDLPNILIVDDEPQNLEILEGILEDLLHSTKGRVPISLDSIDEQIKNTNDRIDREETRLVAVEKRLIGKFSRLERTLALIQQQMGALSMI